VQTGERDRRLGFRRRGGSLLFSSLLCSLGATRAVIRSVRWALPFFFREIRMGWACFYLWAHMLPNHRWAQLGLLPNMSHRPTLIRVRRNTIFVLTFYFFIKKVKFL
jgi:hypothetical protein